MTLLLLLLVMLVGWLVGWLVGSRCCFYWHWCCYCCNIDADIAAVLDVAVGDVGVGVGVVTSMPTFATRTESYLRCCYW